MLGMWEGSFVQWDGSRGRLTGRATAFLPGAEPCDFHDGSEFDSELRSETSHWSHRTITRFPLYKFYTSLLLFPC